ncbi:SpoIID/LytB domain-containing protein [Alkaliphilus transvaalensis]|uniref:SpoIID/LytB domain-containing protein n=1 Tax=Alkaliphilus transvaalensis TaxID=114628 RepID=UPI00047D96AF|nr:SpoIID/LytB domain-containing protein [Alkaliphilus transvaalensis]
MKRVKMFFAILLMIGILSPITQPSYGNQSKLPETIEIGLFFNATAKSTLNIKAANGFQVNQHNGSNKTQLVLFPNTEVILRKDGYYLGSGNNFVEYTGPIQEQVGQNPLQGPYHVQIGGQHASLEDARKLIETLGLQEKPYLVYEGGWKVFVGLYIDQATSEKRVSEIKTHTGQEATVIPPSSTRVQVMDQQGQPLFMFDSTANIYFQEIPDKGPVPLVDVEGKKYRGEITAKRVSGNDMVIVNKLPLDEYLYGVVPREMSASWPMEALKAQAVTARGFAITTMGKYRNIGFDLCNTTSSQAYAGYDIEHARTNQAVDETKTLILTHNGQPISPFYHSNSGGHTENSENVWTAALPYIRGVKDDYSLDAPNGNWVETFTKAEIKEALQKNGINIGEPVNIRVTEKSVNGRVLTLTVTGTTGSHDLSKERGRIVFGLRSTWFDVALQGGGSVAVKSATSEGLVNPKGSSVMTADGLKVINNSTNIKLFNGQNYKQVESGPEVFAFEGKGWGHGLGMSQHGARKMAELGHNFEAILMYYYTGVKVESR